MKKFLFLVAMVTLLIVSKVETQAQTQSFYNGTNSYTLAELLDATAVVDTVTDTGTGALYTKAVKGDGRVTIQIDITKVSGTIGGTLTLYGSLDGATFSALNTEETQTALATKTMSNATATYHFRLKANDFIYYKVGTGGDTTCVYYLRAKMLKH